MGSSPSFTIAILAVYDFAVLREIYRKPVSIRYAACGFVAFVDKSKYEYPRH